MKNFMLLLIVVLFAWVCSLQAGYAQTAVYLQNWLEGEKHAINGKFTESMKYYRKAYQAVAKTDPVRAANVCNDMSSASYGDGLYDQALGYCYRGLAHTKNQASIPDSIFFKLYSSLGTMYDAKEHRDSSYFYFQSADAVLDRSSVVESQIPMYVLHHYLHQGQAFWKLHRYHQSITYFLKAKSLCQRYKLEEDQFYVDSYIAEVFDLLGRHSASLPFRISAAKNSSSDPDQLETMNTGLGYTYQNLNKIDSALFWYKKSSSIHSKQLKNKTEFKTQHIRLQLLLAQCYLVKGDLKKTKYFLDLAESHLPSTIGNSVWVRANLKMERGKLALKRNDFYKAMSYFDQAFQIASINPDIAQSTSFDLIIPQAALHALFLKGCAYNKKFNSSRQVPDLLSAYETFKKLINLQKTAYQEGINDAEERYTLSQEGLNIFSEAIPIAYTLYQRRRSPEILNQLFEWFEQASTTYLNDAIRNKNLTKANLPIALQNEEQKILKEKAQLIEKLAPASTEYQEKLNELRLRWYKFNQKVNKSNTAPAISISSKQIQNQLDPDAAFISYKWYGDNIYTLIITRDITRLEVLPVNAKRLQNNLDHLQGQLRQNPGFGKYTGTEAAIECYKILAEPLKKWVSGKNRLIIARDWRFNFLPFELLETGKKTHDYLTRQYAFSYTYSAAYFWQHPSLAQKSRSTTTHSSLIVAPFINQLAAEATKGWAPVADLDDLDDMGGEKLWAEGATKQAFLDKVQGHHILQLATHAKSEDNNPDDSFIQFYPVGDSRLYLSEIYALPLQNTRLVILSACSGGEGINKQGEGNISLAHGIAQAGCPSVISTIWEANNKVTAFLTKRTYEYLKKGIPIDLALQRARSDFFDDPQLKKFMHPYYWANLTLIGNYDPVFNTDTGYLWFGITGVILVLAVVLYVMSGRSGNKKWPYRKRMATDN